MHEHECTHTHKHTHTNTHQARLRRSSQNSVILISVTNADRTTQEIKYNIISPVRKTSLKESAVPVTALWRRRRHVYATTHSERADIFEGLYFPTQTSLSSRISPRVRGDWQPAERDVTQCWYKKHSSSSSRTDKAEARGPEPRCSFVLTVMDYLTLMEAIFHPVRRRKASNEGRKGKRGFYMSHPPESHRNNQCGYMMV